MAKVTAPLFSFEAHGQLAKTLVFMDWKGINDVRKYTVPANPNSAGQQSQRGFFKDGVVDFHAVPLDADDLAAWNRRATTASRPRSGFNEYVKNVIAYRQAGISAVNVNNGFNGGIIDSGVGQVDIAVTEDGGADAVSFLWGYSPTALIETVAGAEVANVWTALNLVVNSGAIVYARAVIKTAAVERGSSGIYRFGPTS